MVDTIKFSQMPNAGDINNGDITPSLRGGANVVLTTPWAFLPPGSTAARPAPSSTIDYRLRFNTDDQLYEYYDAILGAWTQLQESLFTQGPFVTYTADASIPDAQNLGALANGILKQTITTGVATLNIAVNGTDYFGPGFVIPGTDGGTGINNGALTINLGGGSTGFVLTSDVSGNATWQSLAASGAITTIDGDSGAATPLAGVVTISGVATGLTFAGASHTLSLGGLLNPTYGGLGVSNPTAHGILVGEGASAVTPIVLGAGQILIGTTASDPVAGAIGSGTGILVGNASGAITVSLAAIASLNILSNITGGSAAPIANTLTATIDAAIGAVQGDILYRNATAWVVLPPSTSGLFLQTQGAAANPIWAAAPGASPAALTTTNDTNVTITLGGSPTVALLAATSLTLGWSGQLAETRGGTNQSTYTTGDMLYASAANTLSKLAGNITTTKQYLSQTGSGAASAAPAWATIAGTDITGAALTASNDTNVTLTLGGTPTTALLRAASLALGWTGLLAIGRGGTGVGSVTISPTATAWAGWDANKNFSANNLLNGYTTTATAAGTTTLTVGSTYGQFFTGSTTQTVVLPVTSTLVLGQGFYIVNNSSGVVTVQSSGGNTIQAMAAGTVLYVTCILTSGTTASSWYAEYTSQTAGANFPVNTNISSMTGLTGAIQQPIGIQDTSGNYVLRFTYAPSAVNYPTAYNSATGGGGGIQMNGSDASIPLGLQPKNGDVWVSDSTATIAAGIRFFNAASTQYTRLKVASAQATTVTFTLPAVDGGVNGYVMQTDASGNLTLGQIKAAALPAGTMFNFQFGQVSGQSTLSSNGTWVDTTVTVNITPTSSSNSVLVRAMIQGAPGANGSVAMFRLVRASTAIGVGVAGGVQTPCTGFVYNSNAGTVNGMPIAMEWLDSPATTSATTYKVQYFAAATQTFQLNYWNGNANSAGTPNAVSTISVCEIHA